MERKLTLDKDNEPLEDMKMSEGIKLNTNRSRFAKQQKQKVAFEQRAQEVHDQREGQLKEGYHLGQAFSKRLVDKTLADNRGPLEKSIEAETVGKFVNWIIAVNNDENQKFFDMGSTAGITLILNSLFKMRDKDNEQMHKIALLEDKVKILEKKSQELEMKVASLETKLSSQKA